MFWITVLINMVLIVLVVVIHYESISLMSNWFRRKKIHRRAHLLAAVFGALIAHAVEIWLYGVAMYLMLAEPGFGALAGSSAGSLSDCVYFSLSNYTSLGMGDIQPQGLIRFVAGFETLAGLVLITWTASFLFLEMQQIWQASED